ncbi:MAG: SdrD B-like domain-containing protein [Pseudomonadota bacterium]
MGIYVSFDLIETDCDETVASFDLTANDTSFGGATIRVSAITRQPDNGTITINPDGTIRFVPDPGFVGYQEFEYEITDGNGNFNTGVSAVRVLPVENKGGEGSASVGDRIWIDEDGDGVQGETEAGAAGVTVQLRDGAGNVVRTTTTDANGNYLFDGLDAGQYSISVVRPNGFNFTTQDVGDDNGDSDVNVATGRTDVFTLAEGERRDDIDAGLVREVPPAGGTFTGRVWRDEDDDGVQDGGEPGVPGVTVQLKDAAGNVLRTTTTDASGTYTFTDVPAGGYIIGVLAPDGFSYSAPNRTTDDLDSDLNQTTGMSGVFHIANGQTIDVDGGIVPPAQPQGGTFTGRVWRDEDDDGVQDGGEPGVPGVTVQLKDAAGNVLRTTTTDASGTYTFTDVPAGGYIIGVLAPDGFGFSAPNRTTDDLDSDLYQANGMSGVFHIANGQTIDVDGGIVPPAQPQGGTFTGRVWRDEDDDGVQDGGEASIGNVTVQLKDANGNVLRTTTTDANGNYTFTDVPEGGYVIGVLAPNGFTFSPPNRTTDDLDSDLIQATGMSGVFHIRDGQTIDVDGGLVPDVVQPQTGSIGDRVWIDTDGDGIQDPGEAGAAGVTVQLKDAAGNVLRTTTTDANGNYLFDDVPAGNYSVGVIAPNGFHFTQKDASAFNANGRVFTIDTTAEWQSLQVRDNGANVKIGAGYNGNLQGVTFNSGNHASANGVGVDIPLRSNASTTENVRVDLNVFKNWASSYGGDGSARAQFQLVDQNGVVVDTVNWVSKSGTVDIYADNDTRNDQTVTLEGSGVGLFVRVIDQSPNNQWGDDFVIDSMRVEARTPNTGVNSDDVDSDVDQTTGMTHVFSLAPGEHKNTIDAGLLRKNPPDARDDHAEAKCGEAVTINVLGNDVDPDGDPLKVQGITNGQNGTVHLNADGTVTYTPNGHFSGTDRFTYTVSDGKGGVDTATVTVKVLPNNPPITRQDYTTFTDGPHKQEVRTINVLNNDSDPDGGRLHLVSITKISNGAASNRGDSVDVINFDQNGNVTLRANYGQVGGPSRLNQNVTFQYVVKDEKGAQTTGILSTILNVTPIALDLNGDGEIGVTGETSSWQKDADAELGRTVEFDIDADGDLEVIEWFDGSGDGILVDTRKIGADGEIDGSALFGDEGGKYANGFEKLALLDADGDGVLTGAELEGLGVWVDDGDGVLEEGELQTLEQHDIASISAEMTVEYDDEGRELQRSTATTTDGETILTEDVYFAAADSATAWVDGAEEDTALIEADQAVATHTYVHHGDDDYQVV